MTHISIFFFWSTWHNEQLDWLVTPAAWQTRSSKDECCTGSNHWRLFTCSVEDLRMSEGWSLLSTVVGGFREGGGERGGEGGCGYKRGTLKQLVVATLPPFESLLPILSFCHTGENSHNYVTILKPTSNVQCPFLVIMGCCLRYIH